MMAATTAHEATFIPPQAWRGGWVLRRRFLPLTSLLLSLAAVSPVSAAEENVAGGFYVEEFTVGSGLDSLVVRMMSPPAGHLSARPMLLLYFSTDRVASLPGGRHGEPGRIFLEAGHRVASFDLPAHGERVDGRGGGIAGLAARVAAGQDPFEEFVADGRAVIDECLRRGMAEAGRIAVAGVSRGGYCALRLAAADRRITAVAALAPVTDWREVSEFAALKDSPAVAALALEGFAEELAGRRVYLAIGNHDGRVGAAACTRLVLALLEVERRRGLDRSGLRFHLVDDSPRHALAAPWREAGVKFLLAPAVEAPAALLP
jgi:hypothetical protein